MKLVTIFIFFTVLLLTTGCGATYQISELKEIAVPARTQVNSVKKEGLYVAVRELSGKEAETYLGINTKLYNYIPFLMSLENSAAKAFKIKSANVYMVTEKGDKVKPAYVEEVVNVCSYSQWRPFPLWLTVIGIAIAIPSHSSISTANKAMESDYNVKSLRKDGYILNNQDQAHGILFFKSPAKNSKYDVLTVEVEQLGDSEAEFTKAMTINVSLAQ
jgi:hypothetical protein